MKFEDIILLLLSSLVKCENNLSSSSKADILSIERKIFLGITIIKQHVEHRNMSEYFYLVVCG